MKLNTKSRYAVMALADLALCKNSGTAPLSAIARRQALSLVYLEQIFVHLRRAGLVKSVRGVGGGYCLAYAPQVMTVASIVEALNDPIKMTRCRGKGVPGTGCQEDGTLCSSHHVWAGLEAHIWRFLKGVTLADVVRGTLVQDGEIDVCTDPLEAPKTHSSLRAQTP